MLSHETCCAATDLNFKFVADLKPRWCSNYCIKFGCKHFLQPDANAKPASEDMVQPCVL